MTARLVDIHNHLLPGIDDGAASLGDALALARAAVADGITHCVCTPHMHPGKFDNDRASISAAFGQLKAALTEQAIPLHIAMAAEVRFGLELMAQITNNEIPLLGQWQGKPVLLLEFPHNEIPFGADKLTQWLFKQGIVPMIAHPERNRGVQESQRKLTPFINQGCLFQVTAGSVTGYFGKPSQQLAEQLLKEGIVTVLASDAHNLQYRPPMLQQGRQAAAAIVGEVAALQLASVNPWTITESLFAEQQA
ncbi:tyrosine-protein phosphatase [Oceanisphaera psychrotolerans]|uniref:protein-tyrosine-phosphatase n=1 Tax=Oceanisphaera psychrotolerans TaxID=1414654 RepID=A0A1J4QDF5_9GAMM|nr:CpsB/CapC family capsule biosynthesis tyrosine phosphatase [Oceanisphaera psychrotolerans]OIN07244.1 capsular biosynthesis protein [Oceanisphaera psychrotolerans]